MPLFSASNMALLHVPDSKEKITFYFSANYAMCSLIIIISPRRICNRRCLSDVCLLATLHKKIFRTDLHEIFRVGWQWAS